MQKLTSSLARTLKAIEPFDHDESFMRTIYDHQSPIPGLSPERLVSDLGELQELGFVKVFKYEGRVDSFFITSAGRDYRRNRISDISKSIARYAFQLLVGAIGGLVVFLIGNLLTPKP